MDGVASVLLTPKAGLAGAELLLMLFCWLEPGDMVPVPLSELVELDVP